MFNFRLNFINYQQFRFDNIVFILVVESHNGESLELPHVQRTDMGSYYCIASNGIPPTVSRRYHVEVHCKWEIIIATDRILNCSKTSKKIRLSISRKSNV